MSRSLFDADERYTEEAVAIDREVGAFLDALFAQHPNLSRRELAHLCHAAVTDAELGSLIERQGGSRAPTPRPRAVPVSYDVGCIRVDTRGRWYLCNKRETGWSSYSFQFPTLDALRAAWAVELGTPAADAAGVYWTLRAPATEASQ